MQAMESNRASAAQISRQKVHAGETRFAWRLEIGSMTIRSDSLRGASPAETLTASYDAEGVSSCEMELYAGDRLSGMAGAPVHLYIGYGNPGTGESLKEWFTGTLEEPRYTAHSGITKARAHGPSGVLASRYFDAPVRYQGATLRQFFSDLTRRLYDRRARVDVVGGDDFELEDTVFGGEVALGEAATSALEGAEYVMADKVGYLLRVAPRPRPSVGASAVAIFDAGDYPVGQPEMEPEESSGPYAKVVVFRNDEDGQEVVRAEAEVAYRGLYPPAPNQIYWVPEFEGDQVLAGRVAHETARALEDDPIPGNLGGIAANPDLVQHAPFFMHLDEDEPDGRLYRCGYAATIYEVELDCVAATMDLTYEALRVSSEEITPLPELPGRSAYAVLSERAQRVSPFGEDALGAFVDTDTLRPYYGIDLDGIWLDPDLVEQEYADEAGEDENGLWVDTSEEYL